MSINKLKLENLARCAVLAVMLVLLLTPLRAYAVNQGAETDTTQSASPETAAPAEGTKGPEIAAGTSETEAAETVPQIVERKLFTLQIADGYTKQKAVIYEIQAEDGSVRYGLKNPEDFILLNAASASFQVKVSGKSSYFKNNGYTVTVAQSSNIKTTKNLKVTLKDKSGKKVGTFKLKIVRPGPPDVTELMLSKQVFAPGRETLRADATITTLLPLNGCMYVKNSAGKTVYKSAGVTYDQNPMTFYWDGRVSSGKTIDYNGAAYAADGKYTVEIHLKYPYGKTTKTLIQWTTVETNLAIINAGENAAYGYDWPWTMYVTGDNETDYLAEVVCQAVLRPEMGEIARARALFEWIGTHFSYHSVTIPYYKSLPKKMDVKSKAAKKQMKAYDKKMSYLEYAGKAEKIQLNNWYRTVKLSESSYPAWCKWGLKTYVGECRVIADIYMLLLGHAGIHAEVMEHPTTSSAGHHLWNVVQIGNKWYMADADRPVEAGGNMEDYLYFLRGTSFTDESVLYGVLVNNKYYKASHALMSEKDCPKRKTAM